MYACEKCGCETFYVEFASTGGFESPLEVDVTLTCVTCSNVENIDANDLKYGTITNQQK